MVKDISIRLSVREHELGDFGSDRIRWARLLGNESLVFPSLESLTLDFKDWALNDNQGLKVSVASKFILFLPCDLFSDLFAGSFID